MLNNISGKSVFGWPLWRFIESQRIAISTHQMERWHLRDLHDGRKVSYLCRWLASHIRNSTTDGTVSVESTWIDHYPQAHSYFVPSTGAPVPVSVELADLMLVVEVRDTAGHVASKRAALLQAKCSDSTAHLDKTAAGTSTQDERHLLEANCARIRVTAAAGANSPPISTKRLDYDLLTSPARPGLQDFARYLLIPRTIFPKELPYMTVWPPTLVALTGHPAHFSDVMLAMAGMGGPGVFSGAEVASPTAVPDWTHLVDDLIAYCRTQPPLKRFCPKTGKLIPRYEQREYDVGRFQWFRAFFIGLLQGAFDRDWLRSPLQLNILPSGRDTTPPSDDEIQNDKPLEGFTVLTVKITTSNPLKRVDRTG